jgi:hypothetical protein
LTEFFPGSWNRERKIFSKKDFHKPKFFVLA